MAQAGLISSVLGNYGRPALLGTWVGEHWRSLRLLCRGLEHHPSLLRSLTITDLWGRSDGEYVMGLRSPSKPPWHKQGVKPGSPRSLDQHFSAQHHVRDVACSANHLQTRSTFRELSGGVWMNSGVSQCCMSITLPSYWSHKPQLILTAKQLQFFTV